MLVGVLVGILIGLVLFGPGGFLLARFTAKPAQPAATASAAPSRVPRSANVSAPPDGWKTNGSATISSGTVVLTPATKEQTGTCIYGTPLVSRGLHAAFTIQISGGTGGDGLTFMLLDAATAKPTALGAGGGGMGFSGLPGVAVAFTTYGQPGDPSSNFVGVSAQGNGRNLKYLATTTNVPNLRTGTHAVEVVAGGDGQTLTVFVDHVQVLQAAAPLPANAYVGFSAGTGGQTDVHEVNKTDFSY
jgi:hypothetical protein